MYDRQAMREFLREKINRDIVMKYIFIKSMEAKYDDEYLDKMYRINTSDIKQKYNSLEKEERTKIEKNIRKQIEAGEVDLGREAVNWHRDALKKDYIKSTKINSNKGKRRER